MPQDTTRPTGEAPGVPPPEADLVTRLSGGDAAAGHRFVRDYYPAVYRYLLYLTGHRETAEDLTQETFLQAWRHLGQFEGRASLRLWLHAIARREFLQAQRRRRELCSLEEVAEIPEPGSTEWTDEADLRVLLSKLPEEQRELLVLHYLAGYSSREIAEIIRAPASTVRYRLGAARALLAQVLGEGDLLYLNEPSRLARRWTWLPLNQMYALEARLAMGGGEQRMTDVRDQTAPTAGASQEKPMERREFLRGAAVGAAGLMLPEAEKEIVDSRLAQKVTLALKGIALSELCEHLRKETGLELAAGSSVADEKVTLFCEKRPLREVMRQLSRPFGYTWLRSGIPGQYRYELVQDLRSQLLEEELRNRDRNAALLALEQEIERYRPFLDLSPDEALERARTAPPEEKKLLEQLSGYGWGPIQLCSRLTPQQMTALRAGQTLVFSEAPAPDESPRPDYLSGDPLPPDLARGILQSQRTIRLVQRTDGSYTSADNPEEPGAAPLTAIAGARAVLHLSLQQSERGRFRLFGLSGAFIRPHGAQRYTWSLFSGAGPDAIGTNPAIASIDNRSANARLARDPALRRQVAVRPEPSCPAVTSDEPRSEARTEGPEPKVTTADVLEALHRAAGISIVADFYTRLYKPETVSAQAQSLFDALNQLADAMRMRWNKEAGASEAGTWLQFRSLSYYDDRLKEVPNRLLSRWSTARRQRGMLTLDEVVEIGQLDDAQLDGEEMAEGAQTCWGLKEWRLLRSNLRPHVRFLAGFSPEQRQEAMNAAGLPFTKMLLAQQQKFIQFALEYTDEPLQSLEELSGALLRVDYTQRGWFQWKHSDELDASRWIVPLEPGPRGRRAILPPVRERTREAALEAARRIFPPVTEGMLQVARRSHPQIDAEQMRPQASEIYPTELSLVLVYIPGLTNARCVRQVGPGFNTGAGVE